MEWITDLDGDLDRRPFRIPLNKIDFNFTGQFAGFLPAKKRTPPERS